MSTPQEKRREPWSARVSRIAAKVRAPLLWVAAGTISFTLLVEWLEIGVTDSLQVSVGSLRAVLKNEGLPDNLIGEEKILIAAGGYDYYPDGQPPERVNLIFDKSGAVVGLDHTGTPPYGSGPWLPDSGDRDFADAPRWHSSVSDRPDITEEQYHEALEGYGAQGAHPYVQGEKLTPEMEAKVHDVLNKFRGGSFTEKDFAEIMKNGGFTDRYKQSWGLMIDPKHGPFLTQLPPGHGDGLPYQDAAGDLYDATGKRIDKPRK